MHGKLKASHCFDPWLHVDCIATQEISRSAINGMPLRIHEPGTLCLASPLPLCQPRVFLVSIVPLTYKAQPGKRQLTQLHHAFLPESPSVQLHHKVKTLAFIPHYLWN